MDKGFINKLMQMQSKDYDAQMLSELLRTLKAYPYFSLLYLYMAKMSKRFSYDEQKYLALAGVYATDKVLLKRQMEKEANKSLDIAPQKPKDSLDLINEKIKQLQALYGVGGENHKPLTKEDDIIKEIDSYSEPEISSNPTKEELVERFLQIENPKVHTLQNEEKEEPTVGEIVKKSVADEFKIVTETMAQVYLKQGYKDKAIKIYQQLMVINPKKSVYFATRIKEIEKTNK